MRDQAGVPDGMPLALLLDTDDSLRRACRIVMELGEPAGPGTTPESCSARAAIDAMLTTIPSWDPAATSGRRRADTLDRAARALNALDHRLRGRYSLR